MSHAVWSGSYYNEIKGPHLFTYTYTYRPKFEFSTLNLELILRFFFIEVYFPAFAFKSLRTHI